MLSLLIVFCCVFVTIRGKTCVVRKDEDSTCRTKCGEEVDIRGACEGWYSREREGELQQGECERGQKYANCKNTAEAKGMENENPCRSKEDWVRIVVDRATDAEKADATYTRSIPGFIRAWAHKCKLEAETLVALNRKKCSDYGGRSIVALSIRDSSIPLAEGGTRDFLYVTRGAEFAAAEASDEQNVRKYCNAHAAGTTTARDHYAQEIRDAFSEQIPAIVAVGAASRGRSGGRTARLAAPAHPVHVGGAGAPPPGGGGPGAHAEYVDSLWEEVNQMEEDELRYERALDKLRRAQRSFDMATKLRKLHKKKLRKY